MIALINFHGFPVSLLRLLMHFYYAGIPVDFFLFLYTFVYEIDWNKEKMIIMTVLLVWMLVGNDFRFSENDTGSC